MAESAGSCSADSSGVLLECAICLHDVTNHRALTCQHTFCQSCLEPLVEGRTISCPVCRELCYMKGPDVSSLPRNLMLVALMEKMCQKCKRRDKEVSCKHCGKQLCQQCFELCLELLEQEKNEIQKEIQDLLSTGREKLKEIQQDTVTAALKQEFTDADQLRIQQLQEELAATKLQHKMLSTEIKSNELRQQEIQDEMKALGSRPEQFDGNAEQRPKDFKQQLDTKGQHEIRRLGELYTDIDTCMERLEALMGEIKAHCIDKDLTNISEVFKKWKAEASEAKRIQTGTCKLPASVDTTSNQDQGGKANEATLGQTSANKQPMQQVNYNFIDYRSKGLPLEMVSCKGVGHGEFNMPSHVAVSTVTGNIIVTDKGNDRIQILDRYLRCLLIFGSYGSAPGQFDFGTAYYGAGGVCVTPNGQIIVADTGNNRLQVFDEQGRHIKCIFPQTLFGKRPVAPLAVETDIHERIYIIYSLKDVRLAQQIVVVENDGTLVTNIVMADGKREWKPRGLAVCNNGDIVVADYQPNGKLDLFTRDGQYKTSIVPNSVNLSHPWNLAVDANGNILVTLRGSKQIHVLKPNGKLLHTLHRKGNKPGDLHPSYVAVMKDGNIVVVDQCNHSLQIL